MPKRFATVKWIDGEDEGKITVGIPVENILGFSAERFQSENFDPEEVFAIEWRTSSKKPPGGWPKYDGVVLDVAGTVAALERKSTIYVFPKSPRVVPPIERDSETWSGLSRVPQFEAVQNVNGPRKRKRDCPVVDDSESSDEQHDNHDGGSDSHEEGEIFGRREVRLHGNAEASETAENFATPRRYGEQQPAAPLPRVLQNVQAVRVPRPHQDARNEHRLSTVRAEPDGTQAIEDLFDTRFARMENLIHQTMRIIPQLLQPQTSDGPVELGEKGSGVMVTLGQWNAAKDQRSFTSMAISLLLSSIPMGVLLQSNVKGGKSKISRPEDHCPVHTALEPKIYEAFGVTVRKEFPKTFRQAEMNRAINVKLNKLRSQARQTAARAATARNIA